MGEWQGKAPFRPQCGLAGESFYLPFLSGLLSLHLIQLAWLCLSSCSPRGLMLAVCTPPPGSWIIFQQHLEQRHLVEFPHPPPSLHTPLGRHHSNSPRDHSRGGHSPSCVPICTCPCSIRLWCARPRQEPLLNILPQGAASVQGDAGGSGLLPQSPASETVFSWIA